VRRSGLLIIAVTLLMAAGAAFTAYRLSSPTVLRIAVGPIGSEDVRLTAALVQHLARERAKLRLKLVLSENLRDSAAKLTNGQADLAIIRTDINFPSAGQTVAIMRRHSMVIATTTDSGIFRLSDLRGRRLGLAQGLINNEMLLRRIFQHYEIRPEEVTLVPVEYKRIEQALRNHEIDAFYAVGGAGSPNIRETIMGFGAALRGLAFVHIREAEAIASRNRDLEAYDVLRGAYGGEPPRPTESVQTVAVAYRLIAHRSLSDDLVADLTEALFQARQTIQNDVPIAQFITAPATEKDAQLPVHPGAAAYIDGERQTFFDKYGDWFYLGVMALSILGSVAAAMASRFSSRQREHGMQGLDQLLVILGEARRAQDEASLSNLERDVDDILAATLKLARTNNLDAAATAAYRMAVDQATAAIGERRRILAQSIT
jgi:TRAP transporter TAXI family solute receptor